MFKQKQRVGAATAGIDDAEAGAAAAARVHSAGGLLRATREGLGWPLRDVAAALRIRADYLEALERNTVEGLPGPTYATGFLRAYAEYLGLDGREIVRRFRSEKTGLHDKPELAFPVPLTDRGIPGGGIFMIALLLAGLSYGTWYYLSSAKHAPPPAIEPVPARLLPPPPAPPEQVTIAEPPKPDETVVAAVPVPVPVAASPATAQPTPPPTVPAKPSADLSPNVPPPAAADSSKSTGRRYGDAVPAHVVIRALDKAWVTVKDGEKPILSTLFNKGDS
ncbi:MAG: cytoskeleton protein RodZ, partial [Aliidongia sp.]|nr:cytoskeleton protein RodZ [Aliidongia sp.]